MNSKLASRLFTASTAAFAFAVSLHRIRDTDYWLHLALGRELWRAGGPPITERFRADGLGTTFTPPSWPFELLVSALHGLGGHLAVSLGVALIAGLTLGVLASRLPRTASPAHLALAGVLLAAVAAVARYRFQPRPELVAYLLFAIALSLSWGWREAPGWRRLAALGAVFALWLPIHLSWPFGAALALAPIALAPRLDFWRAGWKRWPTRLATIGLLGVLAVGAWRGGAFAWALVTSLGEDLGAVSELQPLWSHPHLALPWACAAALGLALCWGPRSGRLRRLALALVAIAFGLVAARNLAFSLLALVPPALEGVAGLELHWPRRLTLVTATLAAAGILAWRSQGAQLPWGIGVDFDQFPRAAAAFVKERRLPTPVFNTFDIGAYLAFAWDGDPPTFIDGRAFGANAAFADEGAVIEAAEAQAILDRRGVRTIILRALYLDSGRLMPVVPWLAGNPSWVLVDASDALVFVRADSGLPLAPLSRIELGRYVTWEASTLADSTRTHLAWTIGLGHLLGGDPRRARASFEAALRAHPEHAGRYQPFLAAVGLSTPEPTP